MADVRLSEAEFNARIRERAETFLAFAIGAAVENVHLDEEHGEVHDLSALLATAAAAARGGFS